MTVLDFIKQWVRVYNKGRDWYYYESGDYPELFKKNLLDMWGGEDSEEFEYYTKRDFATVEEALKDDPGHLLQDLVYAAWLTNNDTTYDDSPEDIRVVRSGMYVIGIGSDFETEYVTDIDMS